MTDAKPIADTFELRLALLAASVTLDDQPHPPGHPSGRFYPEPEDVTQATARLLGQMRHLRGNCEAKLDVRYAVDMLDEAVADYKQACYALVDETP